MQDGFLKKYMDKVIEKVLDEYRNCEDWSFEMADIPEHIGNELLHSKYNNEQTTVYGRHFWLGDEDANLDRALEEIIDFCLHFEVVSYAINYNSFDDGFVYATFVLKRS